MTVMVAAKRLRAETNKKTLHKKEYVIMHVMTSTSNAYTLEKAETKML
jgi:hypothetical protein